MNLELFNNLINVAKENSIVQEFINELNEFLKKNALSTERNQISSLEKIQNETTVTTEYRDKMYIARNEILEDYAKETEDKGTMYYVYDKDNNYLVSICGENRSHEIIKVEESKLPAGAGVDSVLRVEKGQYVLDKEATEKLEKEITEKFNELLKEQEQNLQEKRIEGHLYEIVEYSENSVWLIDKNLDTEKAFEEIDFQTELLNEAQEGDIFQYINGEYKTLAKV